MSKHTSQVKYFQHQAFQKHKNFQIELNIVEFYFIFKPFKNGHACTIAVFNFDFPPDLLIKTP